MMIMLKLKVLYQYYYNTTKISNSKIKCKLQLLLCKYFLLFCTFVYCTYDTDYKFSNLKKK